MRTSERADADEALADELGRESFPASDPPATWSGPDVVPAKRGDARLDERPDRAVDPAADEGDDSPSDRAAAEATRTEHPGRARGATRSRAPSP